MRIIDYDPMESPPLGILLLLYGLMCFFLERDTRGFLNKFRVWGRDRSHLESEAFTRWSARLSLLGIYFWLMWHYVRKALLG